MLPAREFFGDEEWKRMKHDYDELMAYRKTIKGKPDVYERLVLDLNRIWIDYYNSVLFHTEGKSTCDCRRCDIKRKQEREHKDNQVESTTYT